MPGNETVNVQHGHKQTMQRLFRNDISVPGVGLAKDSRLPSMIARAGA